MKKRLLTMSVLAAIGTSIAIVDIANADTVNARFPRQAHSHSNSFTRMFAELPSFTEGTAEAREAARQLGARGGILDGADNLTDPLQSILNPAQFSPNNPDNPDMTAGMTFIGQFLDHDITFDRRSALNENSDPEQTRNFRTAAFDLDSLYGGGPERQPELYQRGPDGIKFIVQANSGSEAVSRGGVTRDDLPRDQFGEAIVAESRNDENVIISQLHLAMLKFHNAVTDQLMAETSSTPEAVFAEAQRLVRWHYQWIIVHEYLPATIGKQRVDALLANGPQFYETGVAPATRTRSDRRTNQRNPPAQRTLASNPKIPVEFSVAAYRFGHSQIRPSYRMNFGVDADSQVFLLILDNDADPNSSDPDDFRGGKRAPRRFIDWQTFFDFGDGNVRNNKLIDSKITTSLFSLPGSVVPAPGLPTDGEISLASRNLMRHVNFGLPSGQDVARAMGVAPLSETELSELAPYGMANSTPLWYYVLKEAELVEAGRRMGPVGGGIVGEVFMGLLLADPTSYLNQQPGWTPSLNSAKGAGQFEVTDLLRLAGVVHPL